MFVSISNLYPQTGHSPLALDAYVYIPPPAMHTSVCQDREGGNHGELQSERHGTVVKLWCCSQDSAHYLSLISKGSANWVKANSAFHPSEVNKINTQLTGMQCVASIITL